MAEANNKSGNTIPFSEEEQNSANEAKQLYSSGEYEKSLAKVRELIKNRMNDPHLFHNRILNEFCKSNGTKVSEYKKNLNKCIRIIKAKQDEEDIIASNDKAGCVCAQYNLALVHFHLHQYSLSVDILTQVYKYSDNSDNINQIKMELLLADCYLMIHKPQEAEKILDKLANAFPLPSTEGNNKSQTNDEKSKSSNGIDAPAAELEKIRKGIYYMRYKCALQGKNTRSHKVFKKVSQQFASLFETPARDPTFLNHYQVFLKSNNEYLKNNPIKALRVINNKIHNDLVPNGTSPTQHNEFMAMYCNNIGVIYFSMEKYTLACHFMEKALAENKQRIDQVQRQHTQNSTVTTNGGGGSNRNTNNSTPSIKSLDVLNKNLRFELLYNYGIFLLHSGNSSSAFDVLLNASQAFHHNPRLWLRIAETCIQKCTGCGKGGGSKKSQVAMHNTFSEVGSGCHRKIIVRPINNYLSNSKHNLSTTSSPPASMEYAAACLRNAFTILSTAIGNHHCSTSAEEKTEKERTNDKKNQNKLANIDYKSIVVPCLPGPPVSGSSLVHLFASVLLNSSYVALHLGDAMTALHYAEMALFLPDLSGCHRYLARNYAAEALVSLDKISRAISYLQIDQLNDISQHKHVDTTGKKSPSSDDGKSKTGTNENGNGRRSPQTVRLRDSFVPWHFPINLACAKAYMLFNLAATHCLRSEFDKADDFIKDGHDLLPKSELTPPHAILLSVYLNLHLDSVAGPKKALQILFQHKLLPDENSSPHAYLCEMEAIGYRQKMSNKLDKSCSTATAATASTVNNNSKVKPQSIATQSINDKAKANAGKSGKNNYRRR